MKQHSAVRLAAKKRSFHIGGAKEYFRPSRAHGRDGFFPEAITTDVTAERLARFFIRENQGYRVRRELRDSIVFTVQDLLTDPPFSCLDFISCRNLLIYLRPEEQEQCDDPQPDGNAAIRGDARNYVQVEYGNDEEQHQVKASEDAFEVGLVGVGGGQNNSRLS